MLRWGIDAVREVVVDASVEHIVLQVMVEAGTHRVRRASCTGARDDPERGLLDEFCTMILGTPVQDVADHAAARLEHARRDWARPPVPGVVLPENAGAPFELLVRLGRVLLSEYRRRTGYAGNDNVFDPPPGDAWRRADEATRLRWVSEITRVWCRELGLPEAAVRARTLLDDRRLVLEIEPGPRHEDLAGRLMALEARLQRIEPALEVCLHARGDENPRRASDLLAPRRRREAPPP